MRRMDGFGNIGGAMDFPALVAMAKKLRDRRRSYLDFDPLATAGDAHGSFPVKK
jgi:hypothetical protein